MMTTVTHLDDYSFADPRVLLVPAEHLGPDGLDDHFAQTLADREGFDAARVNLVSEAFQRYWSRVTELSSNTGDWAPPRARNIALVRDPETVLPYVQLINQSTWTAYASDFDPACSNAEFAAYVLVQGDRMFLTGEVTEAALMNAAYWFGRTDAECAEFATAAEQSNRPDAEGYRAIANALPLLRDLYHEQLRPPTVLANYQPVEGSSIILSPTQVEDATALVQKWYDVFQATLQSHKARWQGTKAKPQTLAELYTWLHERSPQLLITGRNNRVLWDPEAPDRITRLRNELKHASENAIANISADLAVVDARTRAFHDALRNADDLAPPDAGLEQSGYSYIFEGRRMIAYNLHEPALNRLEGPDLPYARMMLGARTVHEWCHLGVDSGFVPLSTDAARVDAAVTALVDAFDQLIANAPPLLQQLSAPDLPALAQQTDLEGAPPVLGTSPGAGLVRLLFTRMEDYQANLLGHRFMTLAEQETYVRQNIRTLRTDYEAHEAWRMLMRYLYEYQYLRFSKIPNPRDFFVRGTWFDADYFRTGTLTPESFDELATKVGAVCELYAVDESRLETRR